MGVSKYIEEISSKIEDRIQKNLESIAAAPYPKDELDKVKEASPDSPISKSYGESGRIDGVPSELFQQAAQQDPELFKRLEAGSKSLRKARQNERLSSIDPSSLLSSRYSAFLNGLANSEALGAKLTLAEVLQSDGDEFESAYDLLISDARERGVLNDQTDIDASAPTVIAAFTELSSKEPASPTPTGSPINGSPAVVEPAIENPSVVNLPSPTESPEESVEKVSSTVVGAKVEIPEEISLPETPISINIENEQARPVTSPGPEASIERTETTISSSETINPTQVGSPTVAQSTSTGINLSTTANETSSQTTISQPTTNLSASSSFFEKYVGPLTPEQRENIGTSVENYSSSATHAINSAEKATSQKEKESSFTTTNESRSTINSSEKSESSASSSSKVSESDLRYISSLTGLNLSSSVGEKSATTESKMTVENREKESIGTIERSDSFQEKMGVTKEPPTFSEKIMPASSPVSLVKEVQKAVASSPDAGAQSVKVEQVSSPMEATAPSSTMSESQPAPSQSQSTQIVGLDELTRRLSRIEHLLSNPLEVKLVD